MNMLIIIKEVMFQEFRIARPQRNRKTLMAKVPVMKIGLRPTVEIKLTATIAAIVFVAPMT